MIVLGIVGSLLLLASGAWVAWGLALRGWGEAQLHARVHAWMLLYALLLVAVGQLALGLGLFSLGPLLLLGLAGAGATGRAPLAPLRADLAALGARSRSALGGPWGLVAWPALAILGVRALRGLVAPPLAWDALTYHLYKAGLWVQQGRFVEMDVPDAWSYNLAYPPSADLLWAWAMLGRTDVLLPVATLLAWASVPVGAWAATRALGASRSGAGLAAVATGWAAAALNLATTAYVDPFVAGVALAWLHFGGRAWRERRPADAALTLGVGLLGAAAKLSLLPVGILSLAAILLLRGRLLLVGLLGAALIGAPWLRALALHGNPFYPFALSFAGVELLRGDPEMTAILAGRMSPGGAEALGGSRVAWWAFAEVRFWPLADATGFSPSGAVATLAALGGLPAAWRRCRASSLAILGVAAIFTLGLFDPAMANFRGMWAPVAARLLLPAWVLLVLPIALLPRALHLPLGIVVVLGHALLGLPVGTLEQDLRAMGVLALALVLGIVLPRRLAPLWLVLIFSALDAWKGPMRWSRWLDPGDRDLPGFDFHPIHELHGRAAPLWDALDAGPGHRVAVVPVWLEIGQSVYLYPLLGRRFQNELIYVPPTRDGRVVPLALDAQVRAAADEQAWLRALLASGADRLYLMAPEPIEAAWVDPARFPLLATGWKGSGSLHAIDRAAIEAALR